MKLQFLSGLALLAALTSTPAFSEGADLAKFLQTPGGATGVAAAVTGLGQCDTKLSWQNAYDEAWGGEHPDHLFIGCQVYDAQEQRMLDKSVVARFQYRDEDFVLLGLTYLP